MSLQLTVDKSSAREAVKIGPERRKLKISTGKAVARERLVKTQQAGKSSANIVMTCEV
jgi:hypothetical protein